jgi:hypothetical protein
VSRPLHPQRHRSSLPRLVVSLCRRLRKRRRRLDLTHTMRSLRYISTPHTLGGNLRSFPYVSLSHLLDMVMYFILSTATVLITCTYILLGRTHSTLIPCIHETWYKMLTMFLAAMGFVTMIVAALETRQLHDGTLSTLPEFQCNQTSGLCVPVTRGHGNFNT